MNEATNKMRNSITSTLCFVLLCSAMFPGSSTLAAAQKSGLDGTYILDEADSDNVNEAIEDAVGKLNFSSGPFGICAGFDSLLPEAVGVG